MAVLFTNLLLFQNCQPNAAMQVIAPQAKAAGPAEENQSASALASKDMESVPELQDQPKLVDDDYRGKRELFLSIDINGVCSGEQRDQIEVRETGAYRLTKNCRLLASPEAIDRDDVYFGQISPVMIVEGELFAAAEALAKEISEKRLPRRTSHFCTNRFASDPKIGLEVKMMKGSGNVQGYSVQASIHHFASTMTIQQSFTNVRPRAGRPASFAVLNKKSGAGFKLSFENAASLRGEGFNRFWFRPFAEADTLEFKDLRCWSGKIPSEI